MSFDTVMAPPAPAAPQPATPVTPAYFISKVGEACWSLTVDIGRIQANTPEFASIFLWLSSLSEKDTVSVTFLDNPTRVVQFVEHLPLINAFMLCDAKTVAIIDRMFMGNDCYFILACRDTEATEFGLLNIPSVYPRDMDQLGEKEKAVMMAANALVRNGEESLKLLTSADVETLLSRRSVVIDGAELRRRSS